MGFFKRLKQKQEQEQLAHPLPRLDFAVDTPARVLHQVGALGEKGSVLFIIPGMGAGSGGHTSILRLGTWLTRFGHDVDYVSYLPASLENMEAHARRNLADFQGRLLTWDQFIAEGRSYEVGIATFWMSCYHLLHHQTRFGRKAYFIQDYEPYFYAMGDFHLLAERTYGMGFQHLSLGGWNLARIQAHLGITGGTVVAFPVELRQFPLIQRELRHGNTLRLVVYIKEDAKRAPSLLSLQLQVLQERFRARGVATDIRIFGMENRHEVFPAGQNLGKLPMDDLKALYAWADFGIVASLTNISLVNYEMLACGLPVIDFRGGSAPFFFGDEEMLFVEPTPAGLADLVAAWWGQELALEGMVARAQERITTSQWTWEQTARQFEAALREPCAV